MRKLILLLILLAASPMVFSQYTRYQTNSNSFGLEVQSTLNEAGVLPLLWLRDLSATNTRPTLRIGNAGNGLCLMVDTAFKASASSVAIAFGSNNYGFWRNATNDMFWTINGVNMAKMDNTSLTLGESGGTSGRLDFVASDGDAGSFYINTSDVAMFDGFTTYDFDNNIDMTGGGFIKRNGALQFLLNGTYVKLYATMQVAALVDIGATDQYVRTIYADSLYLRQNVDLTAAITGDQTFTDVITKGFILQYVIFEETAGNTATLDLGTSAGGNDVFINQVITASTFTTVVVNKYFSNTAATTLYLNDDDAGSSWNGASVNVTYVLKRII